MTRTPTCNNIARPTSLSGHWILRPLHTNWAPIYFQLPTWAVTGDTERSVLAWEWILKLIVLLELRAEPGSHQPSPLFHNLQPAKIFCVDAVTRSLAPVSRWTQDPTMEDKWRCPNVPMGHFFVHYDITVSRVPWPGPEYCQRTMGQQSPVGHAHCTLGSVEFLSFDIVSLSPSSQYSEKETTCFMAQLAEILLIRLSLKALVAAGEILCTHQSIDVKNEAP